MSLLVLRDFEGIAPLQVVKHRWLSLERAVRRLLTLWPALRAYFDRERGVNDRVNRVVDSLMSVETKLWFLFVAYALKSFNTTFQTSSSMIGTLQLDMCQLLCTFLSNFICPECLTSVLTSDIDQFDYRNVEHAVDNEEHGIGTATRLLLEEESDTFECTCQEANFFSTIREFYHEAVRKMLDKFPFRDPTIRDLSLLDPRNRQNISAVSVSCLVKRFMPGCSTDELEKELRDFKCMPEDQLPLADTSSPSGLYHFWDNMSILLQPGDFQKKRFAHLSGLCKVLLVLPHSTADEEYLFSMIRKIETDQCSSLSPSTVCSLLSFKIKTDQECFRSEELFSADLLKAAKTATERSLKERTE